jgi:hypothetical protein
MKRQFTLIVFLVLLASTVVAQQFGCSTLDTNLCYLSQPFPPVEFQIERKYENESTIAVYQTPLLADLDGDCVPEILIAGTRDLIWENPRITKDIIVIDSRTGNTRFTIPTEYYSWYSQLNFAIADVDNDGIPEIIMATADYPDTPVNLRRRLICYNLDGSIKWVSNTRIGQNFSIQIGGTVGLADFNQDGIPEVYVYNEIFNAQTGVKLIDGGNNGRGFYREQSSLGVISLTLAADLDDNPNDLELACGYTIYKVDITNVNGTAGNSMTPYNISIDGSFRDGLTSVVDINSDGNLDVLVSTFGPPGQSILYAFTLENGVPTLIARTNLPANSGFINQTGVPMSGIVDGSGENSIIMCRARALLHYKYNGTQEFQLIWNIPTNDESGETGITLFDFNQNGINEIVYRDEENLRIIDGSQNPPQDLATFTCRSGTGFEMPIVGDIDNTGETKICVTCGETNVTRFGRLTVFGAPEGSQPWAPSRGVWNQYAYYIFNINDDLTVPQRQLNNASHAEGAFNSIYVQASLVSDDGVFLQRAPNLTIEADCLVFDESTGEWVVNITVRNQANASLRSEAGVIVAAFDRHPDEGGTVVGQTTINIALNPGESSGNIQLRLPIDFYESLYLVVNYSGVGTDSQDPRFYGSAECTYEDNIIQLLDLPEVVEEMAFICPGESIIIDGEELSEPGIYYITNSRADGCDSSMLIVRLQVDESLDFEENITACDQYIWYGQLIEVSGTYVYQSENDLGCDSIVTLNLQLFSSIEINETQVACDSLIWNGEVLRESGQYQAILSTLHGCDSIITIDLEVFESTTIHETEVACDSLLWNGEVLRESGQYEVIYSNVNGCDSIITIDLEVFVSIAIHETEVACDSLLWNGEVLRESGQYEVIYSNVNGCDSIITIDLEVFESIAIHETQSACDSLIWNGEVLRESGQFQAILSTIQGCDSLVTLELDIRNSSFELEEVSECDEYLWRDRLLTESGLYFDTLQNVVGCDSILALNLSVNSFFREEETESCGEYLWGINGELYTASGNYIENYTNAFGCDSTEVLNLTIFPDFANEKIVNACGTYTWELSGETYTETGIYTESFLSVHGCDSVYVLDLEIWPEYRVVESISVEEEYIWPVNGMFYDLPGTYVVEFSSADGCDSIHILELDLRIAVDINFPNIIKLDSDRNGGFTIYGNRAVLGIELIEVYDRWGNQVAKIQNILPNDPSVGWDGKFNGQTVVNGIYAWIARVNLIDGTERTLTGDLTVVR